MILDLGLPISIIACIISAAGVWYNMRHEHIEAMKLWNWSNPTMVLYFAGQTAGLWNGGLSSLAMAVLYAVFTYTNGGEERGEIGYAGH